LVNKHENCTIIQFLSLLRIIKLEMFLYWQEVDENGVPRKKSSSGLSAADKKKKKKKKKRSFPLTALSCGICGQTFKFETHYEPHVKAHEEKLNLDVEVACPLCNETLATKRHLNPHFKKNHPNDGGCCVECLQVDNLFFS